MGQWRRTDYAILAVAGLVLFDGFMTLPYWHLEGNPVVLTLGPWGMLGVKLAAVCGLLWLYFYWPGVRTHIVTKASVWSLTALYGFVVLTNLWVLGLQ